MWFARLVDWMGAVTRTVETRIVRTGLLLQELLDLSKAQLAAALLIGFLTFWCLGLMARMVGGNPESIVMQSFYLLCCIYLVCARGGFAWLKRALVDGYETSTPGLVTRTESRWASAGRAMLAWSIFASGPLYAWLSIATIHEAEYALLTRELLDYTSVLLFTSALIILGAPGVPPEERARVRTPAFDASTP